mgnify:CR=1 FL=1
MTLVNGLVAVIDGAGEWVGAVQRRAGGAAVRPVVEDRAVVAEYVGADLIAVAKHPVAANHRVRLESARVEQADVARAEVEVFALRRVQALYALVAHLVAGSGWTDAGTRTCAVRAIGAGRTRLAHIRTGVTALPALRVGSTCLLIVQTPNAFLAGRRRSEDAQVVHARFGAVAELAVVAIRVKSALHAPALPRFAAAPNALPARSAARAGRTAGRTGCAWRWPLEACHRARATHWCAGLAKSGVAALEAVTNR